MKRILAMALTVMMLWSCLAQPVTALAEGAALRYDGALTSTDQLLPAHQAMHFLVRHWHSSDDIAGLEFNVEGELKSSGSYYFVVLEGYIVPHRAGDHSFDFYLVDQKDEKTLRHLASSFTNAYVSGFNTGTGAITLQKNPVKNRKGAPVEEFSGFSVSAGHGAVTMDDDVGELTIRYDPDVHLVKTHAFYVSNAVEQHGTSDTAVFGHGNSTGAIADSDEIDTANVYIYTQVSPTSSHQVGDVVKDGSGKAVTDAKDLPTLQQGEKVEKVRVYSTQPGLHTDKTASIDHDDPSARTFNLDLESWYVEGKIPYVGMTLDASGSMAFAADEPTAINVLDRLGIKKTANGYEDENGTLITSGHGLYSFIQKIGLADSAAEPNTSEINGVYQSFGNLIGYYSFDGGSLENYAVANGAATAVARQNENAINFANAGTGTCALESDRLVIKKSGAGGLLLDAKPQSGKFTITFSIAKDSAGDVDPQNLAEVMYVGPAVPTNKDYLRIIRELRVKTAANTGPYNSVRRAWLTGYHGDVDRSNTQLPNDMIVSAASAFDNAQPHYITYVYDGENLTTYFQGTTDLNTTKTPGPIDHQKALVLPSGELSIVFGGIQDAYDGANLYIDDVFVYDDALSAEQVGDMIGALIDKVPVFNARTWTNAFLHDKIELSRLLDPHNIDNSRLSTSSYTYFVFDSRGSASEYAPLTYWDGSSGPYDSNNGIARNNTGKANEAVLGRINNVANTGAGWYYIGHNGSSGVMNDYNGKSDADLLTAKRLYGVPNNTNKAASYYTGKITLPKNNAQSEKNGALTADATALGDYVSTVDSAMKFFVDRNGYLRCFFSPGNNAEGYLSSYVYELSDNDYIKAEVLQRALGAFVTELEQVSPTSKVSATRFSTNYIEPGGSLEELVLLDWTSRSSESANMLSLRRGKTNDKVGLSTGYDTSAFNGLKQYNYGMTGSTSTAKGLQSFVDSLMTKHGNDQAAKYMIIFTDGKDTDIKAGALGATFSDYNDAQPYDNAYTNKLRERLYTSGKYTENGKDVDYALHDAIDLARQLKQEGYTIFTVMLSGGPVTKGNEDYEQAHIFLRELSGTMETDGMSATTTKDDLKNLYASKMDLAEKEKYFFSTDKARDQLAEDPKVNVSKLSNVDVLTLIFTREILGKMINDLNDYTVTDYIDPRFDVVDMKDPKNPAVIHLNAGGKVTRGSETIDLSQSGSSLQIELSHDETDLDARRPVLKYDSGRDMYYLEWTGQTIPSTAESTTKLAVWNARVTVKAKDDFIGGNGVMTNGNAVNMNYVHSPEDDEPSSGISDMYKQSFNAQKGNDEYPSKGFPRTVVNVPPKEVGLIRGQVIYLGETLTEADVAQKLIEASRSNAATGEDPLARYYWEYLQRYAIRENVSIGSLVAKIIAAGDAGLAIPYYYLPDGVGAEKTNQTGGGRQESDALGTLTYTIIRDAWKKLSAEEISDITGHGYPDAYGPYPEGETVDKTPRVSKLTVAYSAQPLEDAQSAGDRGRANTAVVSEDVYYWNADYKPADEARGDVGKELPTTGYLITGYYVTEIVSGEVTLQVELTSAMQTALAGQTLTYTADLMRDGVKVGTLSVSEPVAVGKSLYTATFKPAPGYAYTGYDPAATDEYGLPLGVYTLSNCSGSFSGGGYAFDDTAIPTIVTDPSAYVQGLFTKGDGWDSARLSSDYLALLSGGAALGSRETDRAYTNLRFGLFRVSPKLQHTGSLRIDKTVTGTAGDTSEYFTFTVTLDGVTGTAAYDYTGSVEAHPGDSVDADTRQVVFANGKATVLLKSGQSIVISGIPEGTGYTVSESGGTGYTTTVTGSEKGAIDTNTTAVVVYQNHKDQPQVTPTVVPTPTATPVPTPVPTPTATPTVAPTRKPTPTPTVPAAKTGSLEVSKTVSGTGGDQKKDFAFVVMLSDTRLNGTYGDMKFTDGAASFTLRHGQSKTATGLPAGVRYTVSEPSAAKDGYAVTALGASGEITSDQTAEAVFVNAKEAEQVPQTGDDSHLTLWLALMLASLAGIALSAAKARGGRR